MNRRLLLSAFAAAVIIFPGSLIITNVISGTLVDRMHFGIFPLFPGMIGAMMIANNVHSFSPHASIAFAFLLWTTVFYGLLAFIWRKRKRSGNV